MNSNTNSKKTKRTCTCSTCGKTGHNASNKKFHPDYEFTGVSVPAPKKICKWCEHWIEDWLLPGAKPVRDTKWHCESDMIKMMADNGYIQLACDDCADGMEANGMIKQTDWLKEFGTEDPIAALAAAKAMYYVDQRDSPNVLPYKKCYECDGRSSCGNYVEDDWICEDCAPEEEEEEPEPIPIVVPLQRSKCLTPCKTSPKMGRSWYKCLGYDSPCSCAYEAQQNI